MVGKELVASFNTYLSLLKVLSILTIEELHLH